MLLLENNLFLRRLDHPLYVKNDKELKEYVLPSKRPNDEESDHVASKKMKTLARSCQGEGTQAGGGKYFAYLLCLTAALHFPATLSCGTKPSHL